MGTIVLKKGLSNIDSDAFTCTLVKPVAAGKEWSAFVTGSQSWSMSNVQMSQYAYPILAMVKSSDGEFFTIFPAVLMAKVDIKPGDVLRSRGYTVETKRPIKAGDSIPVLVVGADLSILSVEAIEGTKAGNEGEPWFTAFLNASAKALAMEHEAK